MKDYSELCGAQKPNILRSAQLRKHIATKCATINLGKTKLKDVPDYLGHHAQIHLEHYRWHNVTKYIVRMSNILEKAQGDDRETSFGQDIEQFSEYIQIFLENPKELERV